MYTLREKCPNTKFFLVCIFLYSDQKKLCIWSLFTQWYLLILGNSFKMHREEVIHPIFSQILTKEFRNRKLSPNIFSRLIVFYYYIGNI